MCCEVDALTSASGQGNTQGNMLSYCAPAMPSWRSNAHMGGLVAHALRPTPSWHSYVECCLGVEPRNARNPLAASRLAEEPSHTKHCCMLRVCMQDVQDLYSKAMHACNGSREGRARCMMGKRSHLIAHGFCCIAATRQPGNLTQIPQPQQGC